MEMLSCYGNAKLIAMEMLCCYGHVKPLQIKYIYHRSKWYPANTNSMHMKLSRFSLQLVSKVVSQNPNKRLGWKLTRVERLLVSRNNGWLEFLFVDWSTFTVGDSQCMCMPMLFPPAALCQSAAVDEDRSIWHLYRSRERVWAKMPWAISTCDSFQTPGNSRAACWEWNRTIGEDYRHWFQLTETRGGY